MKVLNLLSADSAKLEHSNRWKAWEKKDRTKVEVLFKLLDYSTDNKLSVSKKYFHVHCTSWLQLFSSLAWGHESES